jgi:hypothetical protein
VLHRWARDVVANFAQALHDNGRQYSKQAGIARLKREAIKLKAERDVLEKRSTSK